MLGYIDFAQCSATRSSFIVKLGSEMWEHTKWLSQEVAMLSFCPAYRFNYQKNFTS